MSKVDKEQLAVTMDALVEAGVLKAWTARPLGIYWLFMPDGTRLTPDTRETAMWVMGASAAMLAHGEGRVAAEAGGPEPDMDQGFVHQVLDALVEINAIRFWEVDEDGDFAIQAEEPLWFSPDTVGAFVSGAVVILQAQTRDQERANAALIADEIRQKLSDS